MPIVSVVGARRGLGKTRVAVKLIEVLREMGMRVLAIKHVAHELDLSKDSALLLSSGAEKVILASCDCLKTLEKLDGQPTLEDLAGKWSGAIIAEGFRASEVPKIVVAAELSDLEVDGLKGVVLALVVDENVIAAASERWPKAEVFSFKELEGLGSFVHRHIVKEIMKQLPGWGKKCAACGHRDCNEFANALMKGEAIVEDCISFGGDVEMWVDGERVELTKFPIRVVKDVIGVLAGILTEKEIINQVELVLRWRVKD